MEEEKEARMSGTVSKRSEVASKCNLLHENVGI